MKINRGVVYMLAVVVFGASPTASLAQRSGSHGSTAHATVASASAHAPATVTRGTSVANFSLTRAPVTVIAQKPVVTPGPVFIPGKTSMPNPVSTSHSIYGSNRVSTPNQVFTPNQSQFGLLPGNTQLTPPVAAMSREEVLQQLGQPLVSFATRTSETLYFGGGLTVTLNTNGQVTGVTGSR